MKINPDEEIVVTCGSTEAMMASMMSVCNPGDKVVIFSPFYENYGADTILSGAEPIYVPLKPPVFTFDAEELENAYHHEELPPARRTVLCVLGAVRGVGGIDSWGSDVEDAYHISAEEDHEVSFNIAL